MQDAYTKLLSIEGFSVSAKIKAFNNDKLHMTKGIEKTKAKNYYSFQFMCAWFGPKKKLKTFEACSLKLIIIFVRQ